MPKYTSILANGYHEKIRSLKELKDAYHRTMGFFLDGKAIGSGDLNPMPREKGSVHTEAVGLDKPFRKKGHGLPMYLHLIRTAKRIGAKRIYSSYRLNEHSRRMWSEKLAKLFDVKTHYAAKRCRRCGCNSRKPRRYSITLR